MTKIADELAINARHLRERAKRVEAAWCEATGIKRLSIKRGAEDRASRLVAKRIATQRQQHRDRRRACGASGEAVSKTRRSTGCARWRARRPAVPLDPARQIIIQRDGTSGRWRAISGDGVIIRADFTSNAEALRWIDRHERRRRW
jgi:hypothetical protein